MQWRKGLAACQNLLRKTRTAVGTWPDRWVSARRAWGEAVVRRLPARVPIASKLAVVFSLLIGVGMGLLGVLVGTNQAQLLEQQIDEFGTTLVRQAAETAQEPLLANDQLGLELIVNNLVRDENIRGAALFNDEGRPVVSAGQVPTEERFMLPDVSTSAAAGKLAWDSADSAEAMMSYYTPVRFRDIVVGYALLSFDRSLLERAKGDTTKTVTTTTLLVLVLGIAASFWLAGRITRPIHRLMDASRAMAEGRYDFRFTDRRNDELGVLMEAMNSMGEGLLRKGQVEQVFSRYVSPQVARQVLSDLENMEQVTLGGRHVEASVLFADIVGFTSMSESMSPQEVSAMLNEYFTHIAQAVAFCGGHIDKYMGDCAMIVFGVPEHYEDHAFRATACAWMILKLVEAMNERRRSNGQTPVEFRIGVNSGQMLAGNMGSAQRMEYTVVGDAVNLASRLSHAGEPGQAIITGEMRELPTIDGRVTAEQHGNIRLRGKKLPVAIFLVTEVLDPFREEMLAENRRIIDSLATEAA